MKGLSVEEFSMEAPMGFTTEYLSKDDFMTYLSAEQPILNSMKTDDAPKQARPYEVARYQYGQYAKVRMSDKNFYWTPKLDGADPGLYNTISLNIADYVFVVEGEKDVETFKQYGIPAVCSGFGSNAKSWKSAYNALFAGKRVFICPDNDEVGYKYAEAVRENIASTAKSAQVLDLLAVYPQLGEHGDISDIHAAAGKDGMIALLKKAIKLPPPNRNGERFSHRENENTEGTEKINNKNFSKSLYPQSPLCEKKSEPQPAFAEFTPFDLTESLPQFPIDSLTPGMREFALHAAETVQAPIDMIASCMLGALEIACQGRYPVRLPNKHIERPCLYIAPIAPPSERKSGVIEIITKPLVEFENEYNKKHGSEVNQNNSERKLLEGKIANAEHTAVKAKRKEERLIAEHELRELNEELAEFEEVHKKRLMGADVTPEKLAVMIQSQGGVFALVSAEGGGLFENIGRYSDKGGLEIYLNGYSGDRVCVDRKNSESIVLDCPMINIIAPCQPYVIKELFSDKQKSGRGLLSRILYVKCQSRAGSRNFASEPLDERVQKNYHDICRYMLLAESEGELAFDEQGLAECRAFFNEIEPQLEPDEGELAHMGDWAGKLPGNMTRLAGLIHCMDAFEKGRNPLDTPINAREARMAAELARFFLAHAKAVYSEQSEPESIKHARYLWERIKTTDSFTFHKRELQRKTQKKKNFDFPETLQRLIDRGYIRMALIPSSGRGRPVEMIYVNPEAKD